MTGQALGMSHPAQGGLALLQAPSLTLRAQGIPPTAFWSSVCSTCTQGVLRQPPPSCLLQPLVHLSAWLPALPTPDWPALAP